MIWLVLYWYFMDKWCLSKTNDTNLSISWAWSFCATSASRRKGKPLRVITVLNQSRCDTQTLGFFFMKPLKDGIFSVFYWKVSNLFEQLHLFCPDGRIYSAEVFMGNIYFYTWVLGVYSFDRMCLFGHLGQCPFYEHYF